MAGAGAVDGAPPICAGGAQAEAAQAKNEIKYGLKLTIILMKLRQFGDTADGSAAIRPDAQCG